MAKEADAGRDPQKTEEPRAITLKPWAVVVGATAAYAVSVALGIILSVTGLGAAFYLLPLAQFLALYTGGFIAGRWAGTSGFVNGVAVAVVWIAVWAVQNALYEARLVQEAGPMALPRMNMGGIILGDVLNLSAAAFGGWLSERKGS